MRMSSAAKKGDKGKSSTNSSLPQSKDTAPNSSTKTTNSKVGESKNDSSKAVEQINPKLTPTAEQLRLALVIGDGKKDDPELPEKINKLVELTNCSSDAAIIALHDSNNDLDHAIAALLDGETEGDWEVSGKKKKPKQTAQQPGSAGGDGTESGNGAGAGRGRDRERDRPRSNRGGPPRLRGRGRGRDNKENVEDGEGEHFGGSRGRGSRSGPRMSNGPGREGSGSRGSRGGRGGFRRGQRGPAPTADTWEEGAEYSALTNVEPWGVDFPSAEDWDNEEYIGSLVETKVFTPSQSASANPSIAAPTVPETTPLTNGSTSIANGTVASNSSSVEPATPVPSQVHYPTINNSAQQCIDLNALLQKTSGVTVAGSSMQQQFLQYSQATDALKAAMGVGGPSGSSKSSKPLRAKIPPSSKIPLSAVEMPDDPIVSGLDVKFGTLDFGIEPSGFDMNLDVSMTPSSTANINLSKQADHHHQQPSHGIMSKMEQQYANSASAPQPPAPSSLPKPDTSLGGFSASSAAASQQSMVTTSTQVKSTNSPASYPYGTSYAPPGVNSASSQATTTGVSQPAGAYPSSSQTSAGGVYSNNSATGSGYQGASSQGTYGSYAQQQPSQQQQQQPPQQQQQQQTNYQTYNNKMTSGNSLNDGSSSVTSLRGEMPSATSTTTRQPGTVTSATTTANKPAGTTLATSGSGLPNMPPGVPMLGPGSFIMGQAPGLPYYAATAAGMQQHPMYSLEDMQYRYPHLAAGYYDMGYQSPTGLGGGRDGTLASLAYASGTDSKFSRNENNSPVPTSLSQNAAQSHGGAFITPAAAAATPLGPAYAYYYSGGVMPGGYQFGAPAALYPVSAATSGHAASGAAQYGKGGLSGSGTGATQSGQTSAAASAGGPTNASASGYASYGSTYDDFSKAVYNSVNVGSTAAQTAKIGGVGASSGPSVGATGSTDLGPNVYGKTHNQLGKINTYDKTGGFHTGTPPPYGLAGNANATPLGVGVSVGVNVGGPSPYGAQHMFIPTLAPHQSQHSHMMHQQLHQDSTSGPGQRSQSGGQQNKQGSKPSYGGGSYWGSN